MATLSLGLIITVVTCVNDCAVGSIAMLNKLKEKKVQNI